MISQRSAVLPRLVIFEGIMGSGKTTATLDVAARLAAAGFVSIGITEGTNPHPIRFDWDMPWEDMPPAELAMSSVAKWRSYVDSAVDSDRISIVDGQLFHGNLTSLLLLRADVEMIREYCRDVVATIAPLQPLLVYFRQADIDSALRAISAERGPQWVNYQVDWKLSSPYAVQRGLTGFEGLVALYRDYRALTDGLFAEVDLPKICIETSQRQWAEYDAIIDRALTDVTSLSQAGRHSKRPG